MVDLETIFGQVDFFNAENLFEQTINISYCSWDSQGKNTEVVCYSLL